MDYVFLAPAPDSALVGVVFKISSVLLSLFQILTIPVKALIAVGTLSCSPKHIIMPPSFPVSFLC